MNPDLFFDALGFYRWTIIPFGLFLGLLGYRMYKVSLYIIGLFLGIAISPWLGEILGNETLGLILGVLLGVIVGVVTHILFRLGLFIAGMTGGYIVASLVILELNADLSSMQELGWYAIAVISGGLLTNFLYKFFIILIITIIGTYMIYMTTNHFLPPETESWSWALYVILLFVFFIVQTSARNGHPDPMTRIRRQRRWR